MAVTFDAVGPSATGFVNTSVAQNGTVTWTHVVGSGTGRYLLVGFSLGAAAATATAATFTVTFAGSTMTQLAKVEAYASGGGNGEVFLYGLLNPTSGSGTVSITTSGAGTITGGSLSFAGASGVGTAVSASGHSTTVSVSVTGASANNMVGAQIGAGSALSSTGNTQEYIATGNGSTSAGNSAGSVSASAAGTVTMTGTVSAADDWGVIAVEIIAATVTAPPHPIRVARQAVTRSYSY